MKPATQKTSVSAPLDWENLRSLCDDALSACESASQKCLAAGQALNERKNECDGDFMALVAKNLPKISHRTATTWMRAAANVAKAIPALTIDVKAESIPLSEILSTPDDELPQAAREWKQQWFDFTADKTIKECLAGVFIEGDEEHRVDRAINGKTKGGSGGDRKDFPLFVAVKLKDMAAHFSHWGSMTETQKTEAKSMLAAAIRGEHSNLRKRNFNFFPWPEEVCEVAIEALRERLKKGAK